MLHSRDFDAPELGEIELRHLYERALERSAQLRHRRKRCRAAGGLAALACLVVVGLAAGAVAAADAGRGVVAGSSTRHSAWRLVSEVSAAGSWRALSPSGYEQTFSLVCPTDTTCYADSIGGQLEYTHDGGSTWQQATSIGTATLLPPISCVNAWDCDILAENTGGGSMFLTTTDGGQTWTSQPGPALPTDNPQNSLVRNAMSCATISSCVVIAYHGDSSGSSTAAFTTSDRGASWSQSTLPAPTSVQRRYHDENVSWQFVPRGLSCSGTTCVAVGSIGIYPSGPGPGRASQGIALHGAAAYTSDDSGATWSASTGPPHAGTVTSLTCPDAADCYATSPNAIFETKDGGQTWDQVSTSGPPGPSSPSLGWSFISMSCASSSSCWLSGAANPANPDSVQTSFIGQEQGLLASTADGGATWALSTPPAGVGGVADVTCPDTTTCFALGIEQTGSAPSDAKVALLTNAG